MGWALVTRPLTMDDASFQAVKLAYEKTDRYQPAYRLEDFIRNDSPSRPCRDRCEFLAEELSPDLPNLRILDVGCSLGYMDLFLAEKGAKVTGIDYQQANIEYCQTAAEAHKIAATFKQGVFDEAFCDGLEEGQYDVVFLFSVLHHVITRYGLEAVQRMMRQILTKCDTVYAELALTTEDVPFEWKKKIPADELEIFTGIPDLEITKLDNFPALGGTVSRPMYRVRLSRKTFNGIGHSGMSIKRSALTDGATSNRKYAVTRDVFTKIYIMDDRETATRFQAEVYAARRLAGNPNFPRFLGEEVRGKLGAISFQSVEGETLLDILKSGGTAKDRAQFLAQNVADIVCALADAGLYWNDLRSHNIIVSAQNVYAVDFEVASPVELESTLPILQWLLYDISSGKPMTQIVDPFKNGGHKVEPPTFPLNAYLDEVRPLAAIALASTSIKDFGRRYRRSGGEYV